MADDPAEALLGLERGRPPQRHLPRPPVDDAAGAARRLRRFGASVAERQIVFEQNGASSEAPRRQRPQTEASQA